MLRLASGCLVSTWPQRTDASRLLFVAPRPLCVLLVDDDEIEQEGFRRALSRRPLDAQLVTAEDGMEALHILRGANGHPRMMQPFVVLLDLNMPRMTGIEFLQELRTDPKLRSTIVFVLTTSNDERDRRASYDLNVAGYVVKDEVGRDYARVLEFLECYSETVTFPPERFG